MKARAVYIVFGFAILAPLLFMGFSIYNQYNKAMDFCFNTVGWRPVTFSRRRMAFEVDLEIKNKSDLDVDITDYDLDVYIDGNYAVKVKSPVDKQTGKPKSQKLPPRGFGTITMLIDFNPDEVFKSVNKMDVITGIIFDPASVKIRFKGVFSVKVSGLGIDNFPYDGQYTLKDMIPDSENPSPPCK